MRASVLPALLEVTREEIQALVQAEISKGLKEAMISVSVEKTKELFCFVELTRFVVLCFCSLFLPSSNGI